MWFYRSWSTAGFAPCDTVSGVCVSFELCLCIRIAAECEYSETTLRSTRNILQMNRKINEVPSSSFTAEYGATPKQIRVLSLSRRRCRRINPSRGQGCLVAVCSCHMFLRLMRRKQFGGIIKKEKELTLTPIWRRQVAVCMVETVF